MKVRELQKIKIIDFHINSITIKEILNLILIWSKKSINKSRFICVSTVHGCIESYLNKNFKVAHDGSDISVPDGRPLYWYLKLSGYKKAEHIPGYVLTDSICKLSNKHNLKVGFYGSKDYVLEQAEIKLKKKYKKLKINYKFSPPFKKIKKFEQKKIINQINKSQIDILFVCLGCPKQEKWMYKNKKKLNCIMIGIGAAIDFISGNKLLVPKFLEQIGFAWLFRLSTEPKRLFWRYFSTNIIFVFLIFLKIFHLRK